MNNSILLILISAALLTFISCGKDSDDDQSNKVTSCFTYTKKQVDEIDFNSSCSENAGSYQWDFGDGKTSINPNPTHSYNSPGTYEVTLVVSGEQGNTNTSTQTIVIENNVVSCFTYDRNQSSVNFNSSCSKNASTFYWDFGDGQTSSAPNPTHEFFVSPGGFGEDFNVTLIVSNEIGFSDTSEQLIVYTCKTCSTGDTTQIIISSFCGSTQELDDFCSNCIANGNSCSN